MDAGSDRCRLNTREFSYVEQGVPIVPTGTRGLCTSRSANVTPGTENDQTPIFFRPSSVTGESITGTSSLATDDIGIPNRF